MAQAYDELLFPFFTNYARRVVERVNPQKPGRVLDVACGPGTTSLLCLEAGHEVDSVDFSDGMLQQFRARLASLEPAVQARAHLHHGNAQQLSFTADTFDAAVSTFGLIFFPDRIAGLAELRRVVRSGGRIGVTAWLPMKESSMMQLAFGAFRAMMPDMPEPAVDPASFEDPDVFRAALESVGLVNVKIEMHMDEATVDSAEVFWDTMVRSNAPIAWKRANTSDREWAEMEPRALDYLRSKIGDSPIMASTKAWIGVGTVP